MLKNSKSLVILLLVSIVITSSWSENFASGDTSLPIKIKNDAMYWIQGFLQDADFAKDIQYLGIHGLIHIPQTSYSQTTHIPFWFKQIIGWWTEGKISNDELLYTVQWLIDNSIISVGISENNDVLPSQNITPQGSTSQNSSLPLPYNNEPVSASTNAVGQISPQLEQLYAYALELINDDRANYGLNPVSLSNNQAAQVHADDMLKMGTLSHYLSDGEKPYMVYTRFGGLGYVAQNAAFDGYSNIQQCSSPNVICTQIDPKQSMNSSEYDMMYNDQASNWDHRDNILDKHHTEVSIGIAYDKYSFYMTQNFENNYINYTLPITENNGTVSFSGNLTSGSIQNVGVYYDPLPTPEIYQEHKNDRSYEMGNQLAIIQPPPQAGEYYTPSNETFEIADKWTQQGNYISASFDLSPLVTQPGVYTVVVFLEDSAGPFPVTSYSITQPSHMVSEGFESSKIYYACTSTQLTQYNQLQQQYDTLKTQYDSRPSVAISGQEYQQDTQMYNQLNLLQNQLENFRC
ncbi:MAG: CAP domain-containing protein [Nitrosotalea sp.]